tara:strand:- start:149 stop:451 length:303 start_codon:yes stop_codon:yes gene_type:complete
MNITIDARRWFQKTYGNTYHSVRVYANNKLVGECPFHYGYDESYLQTAHELLQKAGIYPKTDKRLSSGIGEDYYNFSGDLRDKAEQFHITCTDVSRRKDL